MLIPASSSQADVALVLEQEAELAAKLELLEAQKRTQSLKVKIAAVAAAKAGTAVQDVDVSALQAALVAAGQIISE